MSRPIETYRPWVHPHLGVEEKGFSFRFDNKWEIHVTFGSADNASYDGRCIQHSGNRRSDNAEVLIVDSNNQIHLYPNRIKTEHDVFSSGWCTPSEICDMITYTREQQEIIK